MVTVLAMAKKAIKKGLRKGKRLAPSDRDPICEAIVTHLLSKGYDVRQRYDSRTIGYTAQTGQTFAMYCVRVSRASNERYPKAGIDVFISTGTGEDATRIERRYYELADPNYLTSLVEEIERWIGEDGLLNS